MPPKPKPGIKKGTSSAKRAQPPQVGNATSSNTETASGLSQEAEDQFELELCWCIQQLEMCLATGKLPEKQAQDLNKNINILKSNSAPLIKKRQIMRNTLGNYREKMAQDEQKFGKTTSTIKFTTAPSQDKKCMFLKKAACTSTKSADKEQSNIIINTTESDATNPDEVENVQNVFRFNFQIKE